MNRMTKKMIQWLWPFVTAWAFFTAIDVWNYNEETELVADVGLLLTFVLFGFWINKKLRLVEELVKTKQAIASGNIPFLRMLMILVVVSLSMTLIADQFGIFLYGIPTLLMLGPILSGYLMGYFPSMPKDNEFRGKK